MRHSKLVTKLPVRVQGVTVYILDKMKLGDVSTARVTWGSSTGRCGWWAGASYDYVTRNSSVIAW